MNSRKINGKYKNPKNIKMRFNSTKAKGMLKDYMAKKDAKPSFEIPKIKINKEDFEKDDSFVWLGHSTILARLDELSFIVDPMLSKRASPIKCMGPKRFEGSLISLEELPLIDLVLITHNHYDHMDKDTLLELDKQTKMFFVPLDNAKLLIKWGIKEEKIKEFDWYEGFNLNSVTFTFCPTQHFSGRGLKDRDDYLWGSWAIKGLNHSLYVSGDSGYNTHFKQIGEELQGFDVACIECGAYNENWKEVHMIPEESVQASLDLRAKVMLPMHWASFDLSTHKWNEPIKRAINEAKEKNVKLYSPLIGQINSFEGPFEFERWWED